MVGMDIHDAQGEMRVAWMVEAGSRQPVGTGLDGQKTTARVERLVDFSKQDRRFAGIPGEDRDQTTLRKVEK